MIRSIFLFILLFTTEVVFGQSFSNQSNFGIPPLANGQSEWLDFNQDELMDLILDGVTENGNPIFSLYRNNGDNTFSAEGLAVSALDNSRFLLVDVNNDNFVDIIYTGKNGSDQPETKLLLGNGTSFTESAHELPNIKSAQLAAIDFDQNGFMDVLFMGLNGTDNRESALWLNDGTGFYESSISFPQVYRGNWGIADINEDQYQDIIISGELTNGLYTTKVYLNQNGKSIINQANSAFDNLLIQELKLADVTGNGKIDLIVNGKSSSFSPFVKLFEINSNSFTEFATNLADLNSSSIEVLDVENDGDLDILLFGLDDNSDFQGFIYTYDGTDFMEDNTVVDGLSSGMVATADFDQNGSEDIFYSGFSDIDPSSTLISRLLLNQTANVNNPPTVPDGLNVISKDDSVQLSWNQATDDLTATASLSYNLYIGSNSGVADVNSPLANLTDGALFSPKTQISLRNSFQINDLVEGEYYWSVQSKDLSGNSSAFSVENSFVVCYDPVLGEDTATCKNEELSFSIGTAADEVNWYSLKGGLLFSDQNDLTWEVLTTDTLVVEVFKPFLECTVYDTLAIKMLELPISPLPESEDICEGEFLSYDLNMPNHTINWYSVSQGLLVENNEAIDFEVVEADTLIAEIINENNCSILDSVYIDKLDLPTAVPLEETTICKGEELVWDVSGSYNTIQWRSAKNGLVAEDVNTFTDTYLTRDTLFITKINASSCSVTDTVVININQLPTVDLGADRQICDQNNTNIELSGEWSSVQWKSKAIGILSETSAILDWKVMEDDTLYVEATDLLGCVNYDTLAIKMLELPQFDIGKDTILCQNDNILLSTGVGFAFVNWYSAIEGLIEEDSRFLDYQVQKTDTLWAEVFSSNGCVAYDSIFIQANEPTQYSLGEDFEICRKEIVSLSVPNLTDSINWYMDDSLLTTHLSELEFVPDSSVSVSIETFDSLGCSTYDTIEVIVNDLPVLDLPTSLKKCKGEEIIISNSKSYDQVLWESTSFGLLAEDTSQFAYKVSVVDTLYLTATSKKQCVSYDTLYIKPYVLPEFSLGEDVKICAGNTAMLEIDNPTDSINWFSNAGDTLLNASATITLTPEETQTWWAEQWNATSCVFSDTIQITNIPLPEFDAGDSVLICEEAEVQLNPEGINENWTFEWSPATFLSDASSANPMANPEEDTWFFLEVQNEEGCVYTDSVYVALDQPLILDAGEDQTICLGDFTELGGAPTADGSNFPYQYEWSPMESLDDPNKANPIASPSETTTYQLIAWAGNCKADTAELTVHVQLPPEITLTTDTTIGAGDAIQLLASGGSFYQWKPERGLSDATIANPIANPSRTTTYTVEALDSLGCISDEEMTVFVENQLFIPNLFTPNGDGQNDFFKVYGAGIKEIEFQVFTRGGKLLYRTNSVEEAYSVGWNGNDNGNPVESGVYVWSIQGKYFDGRPLSFNGQQSGLINLMR